MFVKVEIISIFVVKKRRCRFASSQSKLFFCGFDCDHGKYRELIVSLSKYVYTDAVIGNRITFIFF